MVSALLKTHLGGAANLAAKSKSVSAGLLPCRH
jgi:hypothetical protein